MIDCCGQSSETVISTEAQRSGEISPLRSSYAGPPVEMTMARATGWRQKETISKP